MSDRPSANAPLPPAVGPDAELIRIAAEVLELNDRIFSLSVSSDGLFQGEERKTFEESFVAPRVARSWELRRKLCSMRASTLEGTRALLLVVVGHTDPEDYENEPATLALLNSLSGLLVNA